MQLIRKLVEKYPRAGYRKILDALRARGRRINHKRVERLWQEHGLARPRKTERRQQRSENDGGELPKATRANERWAIDFLSDCLENGTRYRILGVLDVVTRECLALLGSRSMPATQLVAALDRLALVRGVPEMITLDNGPELISHLLRSWARRNGVQLRYSRRGTPTDNPFIESFNARLRDECSELWWIESIHEAQQVLERWRKHYNEERAHGSLRRQTPKAFAEAASWIEYRAPVEDGPRL